MREGYQLPIQTVATVAREELRVKVDLDPSETAILTLVDDSGSIDGVCGRRSELTIMKAPRSGDAGAESSRYGALFLWWISMSNFFRAKLLR
jgi:hypothetical protein